MKNCKKLGVLLLALTVVATSGIMSFADGEAVAEPGAGTTTTTESGDGATTEPANANTTAPTAEATAEPATGGEQDATMPVNSDEGENDKGKHNRKCDVCKGTKVVEKKNTCPTCGGNPTEEGCATCNSTGTVIEKVECSKCDDNGEILCQAGFKAGVLESINPNGTGEMRYDCKGKNRFCKGHYYETISAEDVAKERAKKVMVETVRLTNTDGKGISRAMLGQTVNFEVTIKNINYFISPYKIDSEDVTLTVALDKDLEILDVKSDKFFKGSIEKDESGVIIQDSINRGSSGSYRKTYTISVKMPADEAKLGTKYAIALAKAVVNNGENEAEMIVQGNKSKSVSLKKYSACTVRVSGLNMGYYYGGPSLEDTITAVSDLRGFNELEKFEKNSLSFESLKPLMKVTFPYEENAVINNATQRKWQCLGFVPVSAGESGESNPTLEQMEDWVFSNKDNLGFDVMTIEEVQQKMKDIGGILYGEPIKESALRKWEGIAANSSKKNIFLQAVWYVTNEVIKEDKKVTPMRIGDVLLDKKYAERPNDTEKGVTVKCTKAEPWKRENGHTFYEAYLEVTIAETATEDVHINLSQAIEEAADKFNEIESVQPGDTIYYYLAIVNNSGKTYTYAPGSGVIATKKEVATKEEDIPKDEDAVDINKYTCVGFDGFDLSKYSKPEYSAYARRINNAPLKELFSNNGDVSLDDESIGEKLRALGYGAEGDSAEKITQNYLDNYYLDWTNSIRASKDNNAVADSFDDLTIDELSVFTNGDTGTVVQETCPTVVEALYYFYYGHVLTFKFYDKKELSLYDQMLNCEGGEDHKSDSDLEEIIPSVLKGKTDEDKDEEKKDEEKYLLKVAVAGKQANNAFQNTKFSFRIEFDLEAPKPEPTPTPTPDPTPDPTPTPTPDPTPEPDPTPDPQPLPPDDPLIPDEPTVDPQPLPSDDPLIEDEDPKQPLPEDEPLEDPDQPKTGDQSDLALWLGVMVLAGGAAVTMRVRRKKED